MPATPRKRVPDAIRTGDGRKVRDASPGTTPAMVAFPPAEPADAAQALLQGINGAFHPDVAGTMAGLAAVPLKDALELLVDRAFLNEALSARGLPTVPPPGDSLRHWLDVGRPHGIVPSPYFDDAHYRATTPESRGGGPQGFEHFLQVGVWQGRDPNPLFDTAWYTGSMTDLGGLPPFMHYLRFGTQAGSAPSAVAGRLASLVQVEADAEPAGLFLQRLACQLGLDGMELDLLVRIAEAGQQPASAAGLRLCLTRLADGTDLSFPLFDRACYAARLADAGKPGPAPGEPSLLHWLRHGRRDALVPIWPFNASFYLRQHPDVLASGMVPYEHFCLWGIRERRDPNPLFASRWFAETNQLPDGTPPFPNYLVSFEGDARMPSPDAAAMLRPHSDAGMPAEAVGRLARDIQAAMCAFDLATDDILFVLECCFLDQRSEVERWAPDTQRVVEFFSETIWRGGSPTPLFDRETYDAALRERQATSGAKHDFVHWLSVGRRLRLNPSPYFDERFYMHVNPDLNNDHINPFEHLLRFGLKEGRAPNPWFHPGWYSHGQPAASSRPAYVEYLESGAQERAHPTPAVADFFRRHQAAGKGLSLQQHRRLVAAMRALPVSLSTDETALVVRMLDLSWAREMTGMARGAGPVDVLIRFMASLGQDVSPSRMFDETYYRALVRTSGLPRLLESEPAFLHWMRHGRAQRLVPSSNFDEAYYSRNNRDIVVWGYEHFVQHGIHEGRMPRDLLPISLPKPLSHDDETSLMFGRLSEKDVTLHGPGDAAAYNVPLGTLAQQSRTLLQSPAFKAMVAEASRLEPQIGDAAAKRELLHAPYCDNLWLRWSLIRSRLPEAAYDFVVCIPWVRMGGADLVGALVARSLSRVAPDARLLVLQTDQSEREWLHVYPTGVAILDISADLAGLDARDCEYLLFCLLRGMQPRAVFNVNSNLCWRVIRRFGTRIGAVKLFSYLFCWEQTAAGVRVGYPSLFFAETLQALTAVLTDTQYLKRELQTMYLLPEDASAKLLPLYTPAVSAPQAPTVAEQQAARRRRRKRPVILWAGRLDRQKRFDIVCGVAALMPGVDFRCWGASVLDEPPDLTEVPCNMTMQGTFRSYDELKLADADGWLYTASWDGLPTILIELGMRGTPIVASAVGGVPELITPETGWPIEGDNPADYVRALQDMIGSPRQRCRRAAALQALVAARHTTSNYDKLIAGLLGPELLGLVHSA